ncbi:MAG: glycerol-3-phosphate 1-O-acyltransferase PlsY [bacterium]|nr:glycerol-3-phosphate 1-O-acyltransferase PlsY [bacterium]
MLYRILFIIGAYLTGGIPFGYLAGKILKGIDIREHGSKNVGATNVLRVIGKGPGIAVYLLDAVKGLLPVLLAQTLWPAATPQQQWFHIAAALAASLGHVFTPYLKFKGGKGVATASGAMLGLAPLPLLAALLVFALVFGTTRYVSLGSICASIVFPIGVAVQLILKGEDPFAPMLAVGWFVVLLILVTHKANIVRLMHGKENRISFKKKPTGTENTKL